MRLTIPRASLRRIVDLTRGAADARSAVPALATILFHADGGTLSATATDLYRAAQTSATCEIAAPGSVCLDAAGLSVRIAKLPEGPITIETTDAEATLRAVGKSLRYSMPAFPCDAFPRLPFADKERGETALTLPAATLAALIGSVFAAVSSDTTRPHVNSALIEWTRTLVRMVSTDGHRLALREAANVAANAGSFLVPLAALTEVRRIVADAADGATVALSMSAPWVHLSIGAGDDALTFSFNTPSAQFPPFLQIIPAGGSLCRVSRAAFSAAVSNVAVASSDKTGGVRLTFGGNVVRIVAESAETGNGFDETPAAYDGADMTAGFNAAYILDALRGTDADEVALCVGTTLDPLVVRQVGEGGAVDCGYVAVVMPMRL